MNFLNSMNWNTNGGLCFACLTIIIDHLFRLPLVLDREGKNNVSVFFALQNVCFSNINLLKLEVLLDSVLIHSIDRCFVA